MALRCGGIGKEDCPSEIHNGKYSRKGNIALVHPQDPDLMLTDDSDCGSIFVGLGGDVSYFHHCVRAIVPRLSYGFSLAQVMASHIQIGGEIEDNNDEHEQQLYLEL